MELFYRTRPDTTHIEDKSLLVKVHEVQRDKNELRNWHEAMESVYEDKWLGQNFTPVRQSRVQAYQEMLVP